MLAICETHPVQYHAPVYQALARLNVEFEVIYSSDFSVQGYRDQEFQANFAWDTDLLGGYRSRFLHEVASGGAACYEEVTGVGVKAALAELRPKVALCLGYRVPFDAAAIKAARQLRVPLLMRSEASDVSLQRNRLKSWLRDWVLRSLYRHCHRLLYVGQNNREHYRRLGVPEHRLIFSPYCVSTAAFDCALSSKQSLRRSTRELLGIAQDSICILFCGKLSKRKGVDLLVQAVKRLPEESRKRVCMIMLGEGALRNELTSQAAELPEIRILITGFKNQRELSPYYHAADLAVLPSITSETWGLVVNEALHHGLPCVVSDRVGCAGDLIVPGVTGNVSRAGDVDDLRDGLLGSLALIGKAGVSEACQAKVAEYSVEKAALGIREAVRSLEVN